MTSESDTHEPELATRLRRGISPRRALLIRRLIGMGIMLAVAYAVFHVIFLTNLLDPLLVYAEPVKAGIAWVMEDPMRAWGALAVIIIPHISLYYLLFDDR